MKRRKSFGRLSILATALVVPAVLVVGGWSYHMEEHHARQSAEASLLAIAQLKVDQIVAWRSARLAEAAMIMESPFFYKDAVEWMTDPQTEVGEGIRIRFRSLRDHFRYRDVLLTDASGRVRLSLSGHAGALTPCAMQALPAAFRDRMPVLCDPHTIEDDPNLCIQVLVPLLAGSGETPEPAGAVVLLIDPQEFFYPLLRSWPIPSRSGQASLVRRDGDTVLLLNTPSDRSDAALLLRIPLSREDIPAVMAATGREGFVQGKDYRGIEVLAVLRSVPDSPWFMRVKVDTSEALSGHRIHAVLIISLTMAVVTATLAGMGLIWQRNEKRHYRSMLEAEEKLRESEERYRTILDTAMDGFWLTNREGQLLEVNRTYCRMSGYSEQEMLAIRIADLEAAETADDVAAHIQKIMAQGEDRFESRHRRKDGTVFDVEISVQYRPANGGRFVVFTRDITERKRAEEALTAAAEQWDATFNAIADLISVQDAKHRLIHVNKAYADTFGKSPEQLMGRPCYEIVHGRNNPRPDCPCTVVFETERPSRVELFEPSLGVYLEVGAFPMFGRHGEIAGCVHIAKDITERKRAEERQTRLLRKLSEINQELENFAYVVSHDLKAPLRGIKTLADWLGADYQDKLDEEGKENLHLLGRRVDRMQNLIDGILQYSRIGRTEQSVEPIDLNGLVSEVVESLGMPEHISVEVQADLPTIEADETRIAQVFQNLLSNAIKYMDKPQGRIAVACAEEDGFWRFSVADNGPGIEEEHFDRIFRLFQTLTPRDESENTGVGLALVKKIVEMYDGRIWVESEIGRGSTFFFSLPKHNERRMHEKYETCAVG